MRIALIGPTYPYRGGIAHHTTLLAREISRSHQLKFISFLRQYPKLLFPGKSDRDPSQKPLTYEGAEYLIDSLNPFTVLRAARAIARFRPELVVIPWWVTFWAPHDIALIHYVKQRTDAEVVILCHNVAEHESGLVKVLLTRSVLRSADRIVTQSKGESEKVRLLLGEKSPQVDTAFHPTYTDLEVDRVAKSQARNLLGLSGSVLLFFGFVRPYKGLDVLLRALPAILAHRPVTLLVVGEFWEERSVYEELAESLGVRLSVQIHDRYVTNEEMVVYFSACDLVVQPYRSVTGSGVCQLAYGLGRPVVATDLGALREVVADGVNGRLVPPDDHEALARGVVESMEPATLELFTQNARATGEKFSWDRFVSLVCGTP
ncbi:MAG: glycosyltransferase [Desulforudis sp.]|jgi:glycosyltransferase involved in cell wall biosynthesis|nr:MAG: glycosyltransferase [Desulforudis sp.]